MEAAILPSDMDRTVIEFVVLAMDPTGNEAGQDLTPEPTKTGDLALDSD